jgi:hypothetical protein
MTWAVAASNHTEMSEQGGVPGIKFDEWAATRLEVRQVLLGLREIAATAEESLAWFESNKKKMKDRAAQFRKEVAETLGLLCDRADAARLHLSNDHAALPPDSVRRTLLAVATLDEEADGIRRLLANADRTPASEDAFNSAVKSLVESVRVVANAMSPLYSLFPHLTHPADDLKLAAERYTTLHRKLTQLLYGWGSPMPDYHADLALDRVILRIERGKIVRRETPDGVTREVEKVGVIRDPGHFGRAFAWNVWREYLVRIGEEPSGGGAGTTTKHVVSDADRERLFECMRQCLARLLPETRWLITEFADPKREGEERVIHRENLARMLGITRAQLGTRVFNIRQGLLECLTRRLNRNG